MLAGKNAALHAEVQALQAQVDGLVGVVRRPGRQPTEVVVGLDALTTWIDACADWATSALGGYDFESASRVLAELQPDAHADEVDDG